MTTTQSLYQILTEDTVNEMIAFDLTTTKADGTTRKYSAAWIYQKITDAEILVFGDIKKTYTSSTIPNNILSAIRTLVTIMITNQLIDDFVIEGQRKIDVLAYWKEILEPAIQDQQDAGSLVSAETVDDYEFQT